MARRVGTLFLFLGMLLLPVALTAQQEVLNNIFGQLRVVRGDFPAHPIMIQLFFRGSPIASMYADSDGKFGFDNLVAGEYHVIINDDAYDSVDYRVILHPDVNSYATAFITLRPRPPVQKADVAGSQPSGSNPYLVDPEDYNRRFPKKAIKEYERGIDAEHDGKPDEAIARYLAALKIAPDYYPAHNNLGSLYLGKSDFKSAEEQFREAVRLDQNEGQPYFNLGNVLMLTGRYSESSEAVTAGLKRRPDSAFGRFLQGSLLSRAANYGEAEKTLRQALALDATLWQAHLQLVNLYLQEGRRSESIGELETFLKAFPSVPAAAKARELLNKLRTEKASAQ